METIICLHSSYNILEKTVTSFQMVVLVSRWKGAFNHLTAKRKDGDTHCRELRHMDALGVPWRHAMFSPEWVWTRHTCTKDRRILSPQLPGEGNSSSSSVENKKTRKKNKNVSRRLGIDFKIPSDRKMIWAHFHFAAEAWCFLCLSLTSQSRVHQESPRLPL